MRVFAAALALSGVVLLAHATRGEDPVVLGIDDAAADLANVHEDIEALKAARHHALEMLKRSAQDMPSAFDPVAIAGDPAVTQDVVSQQRGEVEERVDLLRGQIFQQETDIRQAKASWAVTLDNLQEMQASKTDALTEQLEQLEQAEENTRKQEAALSSTQTKFDEVQALFAACGGKLRQVDALSARVKQEVSTLREEKAALELSVARLKEHKVAIDARLQEVRDSDTVNRLKLATGKTAEVLDRTNVALENARKQLTGLLEAEAAAKAQEAESAAAQLDPTATETEPAPTESVLATALLEVAVRGCPPLPKDVVETIRKGIVDKVTGNYHLGQGLHLCAPANPQGACLSKTPAEQATYSYSMLLKVTGQSTFNAQVVERLAAVVMGSTRLANSQLCQYKQAVGFDEAAGMTTPEKWAQLVFGVNGLTGITPAAGLGSGSGSDGEVIVPGNDLNQIIKDPVVVEELPITPPTCCTSDDEWVSVMDSITAAANKLMERVLQFQESVRVRTERNTQRNADMATLAADHADLQQLLAEERALAERLQLLSEEMQRLVIEFAKEEEAGNADLAQLEARSLEIHAELLRVQEVGDRTARKVEQLTADLGTLEPQLATCTADIEQRRVILKKLQVQGNALNAQRKHLSEEAAALSAAASEQQRTLAAAQEELEANIREAEAQLDDVSIRLSISRGKLSGVANAIDERSALPPPQLLEVQRSIRGARKH